MIRGIHAFAELVKNVIINLYEGYEIDILDVNKNNSIEHVGLTIRKIGEKCSPIIYLEGLFEQYQCGRSISAICQDIVECYKQGEGTYECCMEYLNDFEKAKSQICFRLVNAEMNEEMLKETPHRRFLDLAIIYYMLLEGKGNQKLTAIIKKQPYTALGGG